MVLRFDYPGVGDSAGAADASNAVENWIESVRTAVEYVRSAGASEVALVGLGVGALLASHAAERCGPLTALALWDPVPSGRAYLRRQQTLYRLSAGSDETSSEGTVPIVGAALAPAAAAALSSLRLGSVGFDGVGKVLVAVRRDRYSNPAVRDLVETWSADDMPLDGHDQFLEPDDFLVRMPVPDIHRIAGWTGATFSSGEEAVHPELKFEAEVARTSDGRQVMERLSFVGDNELFTIRTSVRGTAESGPAVIFYGTASEHRVGPVRMWVELSRDLATRGIVGYRFDRRGTGETGVVDDDECTTIYTPESLIDSVAIVDSVGEFADSAVLVGLCSGAWNASYAALHRRVGGVVLVNMADWAITRRSFVKRSTMSGSSRSMAGRLLDNLHRNAPALKTRMRAMVPYRGWMLLGRVGLLQVPELMLRPLWKRGVRTTVLLSPSDHRFFDSNRGDDSVHRLRRGGWDGHVVRYSIGDHSLYSAQLRTLVRADLISAVEAAFELDTTEPATISWRDDVPSPVGVR